MYIHTTAGLRTCHEPRRARKQTPSQTLADKASLTLQGGGGRGVGGGAAERLKALCLTCIHMHLQRKRSVSLGRGNITGDVLTWDVQGLGVGGRMGRRGGGVEAQNPPRLYLLCTWTHLQRQKMSLGRRDMTWDVLRGLNQLAQFMTPLLLPGASPSPRCVVCVVCVYMCV